MSKPRFFRKRIELDSVFNRNTQDHSKHWVGSSFKAFAVIDSNDSNFQLTLVADPVNGSIEGIPLQEGGWHNYTNTPFNGVFENSVAQAGVWVDVIISTEDPLTSGKIQAIVTSLSIISEGSTTTQSKLTVTSVTSEIFPANDGRRIGRLQFKSGTGNVWVGTAAELADPDYQNICHRILAGSDFEYRCSGALSAKTDGVSTVFSRSQGFN